MKGKPKKSQREKDLTSRYLSGSFDEDRVEKTTRFRARNKTAEQEKTARTALMRDSEQSGIDINALPVGRVVQVHSLYSEVEADGIAYLCVVRRTLTKVKDAYVIVGDRVRFRDTSVRDDAGKTVGQPQGVVERLLPRETILTRADSFKGTTQHPIVANAEQMLIVASILQPRVKWGLVDRMIVAARSGGLQPIVCLNKTDLAPTDVDSSPQDSGSIPSARGVLDYYGSIGVLTLQTSVALTLGLAELRDLLKDRTTVLAGHSGVGKSSLIRAIQPGLDLRVAEVSRYTDKGKHTTTSARRYPLDFGGVVIDTPGVKQFGLWGVTADNLDTFFPDIAAGTAPAWRSESHDRLAASIAG